MAGSTRRAPRSPSTTAGADSSRGRGVDDVRGKKLTLHRLRLGSSAEGGESGVFHVEGNRLFFTAGDGASLEVTELQLEGKRRMAVADLLRGHGVVDGDRLGS